MNIRFNYPKELPVPPEAKTVENPPINAPRRLEALGQLILMLRLTEDETVNIAVNTIVELGIPA